MIHVGVIDPADVSSGHHLHSPFVVPCGEGADLRLNPFAITEAMVEVTIVRIIGGVVALAKYPEAVPAHGMGRVVL